MTESDHLYMPGEYYLVPDENGEVLPQKLVGFRKGCSRCGRHKECPGLLLFEGGGTFCPTPQPGYVLNPLKHAPMTPAWRALQMFAKLLNEKKLSRGAVELWDGRVVHFRVEHPKEQK